MATPLAVSQAAAQPASSEDAPTANVDTADAGVSSTAPRPKGRIADTVMLGGRIVEYRLPGDKIQNLTKIKASYSEAIAIRKGKIRYLGDNKGARKYIGQGTEVVRLKGKLVIPGLIDTHIHGLGASVCDLNYMPATDLDAVLGKIKDCLQREDQVQYLTDTDSLLRVSGFSSTTDESQAAMTRYVLDRLSAPVGDDPVGTGTSRPIELNFSGGHSRWMNSQALQNAGITKDTVNPPGGEIVKDENGEPTGKLVDVSGFRFGTPPPLAESVIRDSRVQTLKLLQANGVTGTFVAAGGGDSLKTWSDIAANGDLNMFVNQSLSAGVRGLSYADAAAVVDDMNDLRDTYDGIRNTGSPGELAVDSAKVFCDGVTEFPGQTAAMYEPYLVNVGTEEDPEYVPGTNRGEDPSCADGLDGFQALHDSRWSIMTHALGDRAVGDSLDNFEAIQKKTRWNASRHVVTHGEFVRRSDVERFAKLGVIYNPQAQWVTKTGFMEYLIKPYVNAESYDHQFPLGEVMRSGGVLSGGSDWPIDALNPWLALQVAVTRQSPSAAERAQFPGPLGQASDRISRLQSVAAYTLGSAYQMHRETRTGSLAVGKDADLVIVNKDILSNKVPVHEIFTAQALLTMYQGNVVYKATKASKQPRPLPMAGAAYLNHVHADEEGEHGDAHGH